MKITVTRANGWVEAGGGGPAKLTFIKGFKGQRVAVGTLEQYKTFESLTKQ